jgi:hypothetical protein
MDSVTPDNINELSSDELRSFLGGAPVVEPSPTATDLNDPDPEPEPTPEPVGGEPEPEPEPEPTPEPVGGEPEPDPEPDPDPTPPKQRIRPRDNKDQQVVDLYKSEGFRGTFQDAVNTIYGKPQPAAGDPGDVSPGSDPAPDPVTALRNEVAELETKIDAAAEEMDTAEALRLQRELHRKESEILRHEQERKAEQDREEQARVDSYQQSMVESWDAAVQTSPELGDTNSAMRQQFEAFKNLKEADPNYAPVFGSPKWPEILVREFLVQNPPPAPAGKNPPPAPRRAPGSKVLTTGNPPPAPRRSGVTKETVVNNLDKLTTDKLRELLGTGS